MIRLRHLAIALMLSAAPAAVTPDAPSTSRPDSPEVDPNKPVLCLVPGRVRRLGSAMTYQERRKPVEMTASECEIRGGEYTLFDRAHTETALAIWREAAQTGDPEAQVNVGEIYEKGWLGASDYDEAARWYTLAAEQGNRTAQRRLAYLHEHGLGVAQDARKALALWRSALDIDEELVLASELDAARNTAERRIAELTDELERQNILAARLQRTLDEREGVLVAEREELNKARQTAAALQRELAEVRTNGGDSERQRELEQQLAAQQAELAERDAAVELLTAELEGQRAQISASNRQAEVREAQLQRARAMFTAEAARGDALLERLVAQSEALEDMEARLAQSEESDQVEELQRILASERERFAAELAAADLREEELDAALAESRAERSRLAESLGSAQERLADLDRELAQTQEQLAEASATEATLQLALEDRTTDGEGERDRLQTQLQAQRRTIEDLQAERNRLSERWQDEQTQRNQLLTELTSERKTAQWLESELKEYQGKLHRALHEQQQAERALEELQFEKEQLIAEVRRLGNDLQVAKGRGQEARERLAAQLDRTKSQLADANQQMAELQRTKARLESQVVLNRSRQQTQTLAMRGLIREPAPVELPAGLEFGKYRALIIANYDYLYLNDLASPRKDAAELQSLLTQRYGFDVEVRINLTRSEMYQALSEIGSYDDDDFALVYYAGHGLMDEHDEGYWLPTDYRQGQPLREAISTNDITRQLKQSPARHILLMADSCYAGALLRNAGPIVKANAPELMKFWVANRSRTVLTSGGLKPVLDQGPQGHSVFAAALLQSLRSNQGALNGERLYAQVHNSVLEEAAKLEYLDQQPQFAAIEDAGHENGQFVFIRTGV